MSCNQTELRCLKHTNTSANYSFFDIVQKPVEIYVFVDPLSTECWSLEPYLIKLAIEYGRFFTIRPIINGHYKTPNMRIQRKTAQADTWRENAVLYSYVALAIKAAELQGKNAGRTFLRKVREDLFIKKKNIADEAVLVRCAEESNLDVQEFKKDLYSDSAKRAFQCDLKIKKEMGVDHTPTIVLFNHFVEEQGVKISGLYPYYIYVRILSEVLQREPIPAEKPPLEDFLAIYGVVSDKDIAVVYDWTLAEADRRLKELLLKQTVSKKLVKNKVFWKYNNPSLS